MSTMENEVLTRQNWISNVLILGAILKKEFKHFTRYPLWMVSGLINPLLWIMPLVFIGVAFVGKGKPSGFAYYTGIEDYVSFLVLGAVVWNYVMSVFFGIGFSLKTEMWQGTLEQNWMAPIHQVLLLVGRSLFNVLITTLYGVAIIVGSRLLFGFRASGDIGLTLLVVILTLLNLYGFGFVFSGFVLLIREPGGPANTLAMSLELLCGIIFPITVLPGGLQYVSRFIPLTYSLDALRGILLGSKTIMPLGEEILILTISAIILPVLGLVTFRYIERRGRIRGTLGQY